MSLKVYGSGELSICRQREGEEREKRERKGGREDASDVFTKVNRGGFREIRTGVGRAVKTRTDARGME